MKIFGIDTTGESMSVALTDGDALLCEVFADIGKKHSQTLMEVADEVFRLVGHTPQRVDAFAVAAGPGSFTGIRIGVAAVSALAYAAGKPVFAVNTLDALLENAAHCAAACAVMDARRGEVYAKARCGNETVVDECAMPLEDLLEKLASCENVVFIGDASVRYKDAILEKKPDGIPIGPQFALQRASSVCMCARKGLAFRTAHDGIRPHYLRESQAERMKKSK